MVHVDFFPVITRALISLLITFPRGADYTLPTAEEVRAILPPGLKNGKIETENERDTEGVSGLTRSKTIRYRVTT